MGEGVGVGGVWGVVFCVCVGYRCKCVGVLGGRGLFGVGCKCVCVCLSGYHHHHQDNL